ncbi:MAG: thioesterase domain-containing protein [Thermoplasmata archaeon]
MALLVMLGGLSGGAAARPYTVAAPRGAPPCGSGNLPTTVNGSLDVLGNLTPVPSSSGVNLTFSYTILTASTTGGTTTYSCGTTTVSLVTGTGGQFHGSTAALRHSCIGSTCISQTGPFTPARLTLQDAAPPGYYLNGTLKEPVSHLYLIASLDHLAIQCARSLTASAGAPLLLGASARDGDERPSPALLTYQWSVTGAGWTLSNQSGPTTTLTGTVGASPAVVTLAANGSFEGDRLPGRKVTAAAEAVATTLSATTVSATRLDVGEPTTFDIVGSGAAGYAYVATLLPGLSGSPASESCPGVGIPGGMLQLSCSFSIAYAGAGSAAPVAYLSNGYSNGSAGFPAITIAPTLMPEVSPDPILAYAGETLTVTGSVAGGTGTAPFGPVCLTDGIGGIRCAPPPGPSWSFSVAYPLPGTYRAEFTVLDNAGVNATEAVPVTVGLRPTLGALAAESSDPPPGAPDWLRADLTGGIAPYDFWFNDSRPAGTVLAGTFLKNGEVGGNLSLAAPGPQAITLTVVDALGTHVASELLLDVSVGTALGLEWAAGGPNTTGVAGRPAAFSLEAVGAGGARVADFGAWVNLTVLAQPIGPFYLNGSIRGALPRGPPATYTFRPGDWESGYLNFTLTLLRSGAYYLNLASILPVADTLNGTFLLEVLPQLTALRLVDPTVALPGARTNDTLWALVDPFGNPALPGELFIIEEFGGGNDTVPTPVRTNGTAASAWINYSAPEAGAGILLVVSAYGERLLGPLVIPAQPPASLLVPAVLLLTGGFLAAALAVAVLRRRSRTARPAPPVEVDPEELRHQAEGRDRLLSRIRADGPLDLEAVLGGTAAFRPDRAEAAEWLASLLTEGLVRAPLGPDGVPRFTAAPERPGAPAPPRVHLDTSALDRALRAAAEEPTDRDGTGPPPSPPYGGG